MEKFVEDHEGQLRQLNIPEVLWEPLLIQLQGTFVVKRSSMEEGCINSSSGSSMNFFDHNLMISKYQENLDALGAISPDNVDCGSLLVLPHVCSWDVSDSPNRGMWDALSNLPVVALQQILHGLQRLETPAKEETKEETICTGKEKETVGDDNNDANNSRKWLLNELCRHPLIWSRVILYRSTNDYCDNNDADRVRAAISSPPYSPQVDLENETDTKEADLMGPFPFRYHIPMQKEGKQQERSPRQSIIVDCSMVYISGDVLLSIQQQQKSAGEFLPTVDLVPTHTVPNYLTRAVRYAGLLGVSNAPEFAIQRVKEVYSNFVHNMHLVRQEKLQQKQRPQPITNVTATKQDQDKVWRVYTDSIDPMQLRHSEAGLTSPKFQLVSSMNDADIIYSYKSLFAPGSEYLNILQQRQKLRGEEAALPLINQFPYEGAFVQKDHLGREILKQYGLPSPDWALETYDLDVQFGEFLGAAVLQYERNRGEDERGVGKYPLWIVKPSRGTQSKGHVITRSIAHVLKLVDSGESRVAQRYIENPICFNGRKVDCRCIVMMTSASPPGYPTLYMHNRFYFRIAGKKHTILEPSDLIDQEGVLTAMHLLDGHDNNKKEATSSSDNGNGNNNSPRQQRGQENNRTKLPVDYKTIAKLEEDYKHVGFDWKKNILPKIKFMVRELFNGMTLSYPKMGESGQQSRGLYGIDMMFQIVDNVHVEVKLTEVTFCPSNNAICDAYERDEKLYCDYSNEIFECLFLNEVSDNIIKL